MVYEIVFKKRFQAKLEKLLLYIEGEFGLAIAKKFAEQLQRKFDVLQRQPDTGGNSASIKGVKSILVGRRNRIYYWVENKRIIVLNIYDTRVNPLRNKLK